MRRTAEDAARTRVALLEAALESFEEKGWRGATFEHVARRAGVTRGAVHHHFRDKRALLLDDWHERIEGIVAASGWSASRLTPGETAGLVLVLLQGFTVTAALRPHDLPQSDKLDSTITVLVRGLLGS